MCRDVHLTLKTGLLPIALRSHLMIRVWRVVVVDFQVQNLESCERSQDIECAGWKGAFKIWAAVEQDTIVFSRNLGVDDLRYGSIVFIVLDIADKR